MPKRNRSLAVLLFLSLALVGIASADNIQSPSDLTVNLSMDCPPQACQVFPYLSQPGDPASGFADFSSLGEPWSYNFLTGDPINWTYNDQTGAYNAEFGLGGTFTMNGPDGLTFTGQITGGTAFVAVPIISYGVDLTFTGQWSNGIYGYGSFTDTYSEEFGNRATLNAGETGTTPEPASVFLLGTGLLSAVGWKKRFLRR